jgi:uncharacterized protein with ParB-like and HNH nuclease domain
MTMTLIDIFHKMENGSILNPSFNRGFVWKKAQIKALFESIYLGYPIGMILAVRGEGFRFENSRSTKSHFPDVGYDHSYSSIWVIDGSQRLSALYSVLRKSSLGIDMYFDVVEKEFVFKPKEKNKKATIKMSDLFDYKAFMQAQENLFFEESFKVMLDDLNELHRKFQDYQVPMQIIEDVNDNEVIEIFSRLNMSGSSLKKSEVEKANSYKKLSIKSEPQQSD